MQMIMIYNSPLFNVTCFMLAVLSMGFLHCMLICVQDNETFENFVSVAFITFLTVALSHPF